MSFFLGIRTTLLVSFVALIDTFGWGRAEAAGAQPFALIFYVIMNSMIGPLVDRILSRKVIIPGIIWIGLGLFLCTQIQTLFQLYVFFDAIVGVGMTCLGIASFTIILTHWFERKRRTVSAAWKSPLAPSSSSHFLNINI
jgi:MFS family permease